MNKAWISGRPTQIGPKFPMQYCICLETVICQFLNLWGAGEQLIWRNSFDTFKKTCSQLYLSKQWIMELLNLLEVLLLFVRTAQLPPTRYNHRDERQLPKFILFYEMQSILLMICCESKKSSPMHFHGLQQRHKRASGYNYTKILIFRPISTLLYFFNQQQVNNIYYLVRRNTLY